MSDIPMMKVEIEFHGPAAIHNMPCAVCHVRKAVYQCNTGIFQPCWSCQHDTWELRKVGLWRGLFRRTPRGTRYPTCVTELKS